MAYRLPEGERLKRSDYKEMVNAIKEFTGYSLADIAKTAGRDPGYLMVNLYSKSNYREHMSWSTAENILMPFMFGNYYPPVQEKMTRQETGEVRWKDHPKYEDFTPTRELVRGLREELGCGWPVLADYWEISEGSMCDFISNTDKKYISKKNAKKWARMVRKVRTLPERTKRERFPKYISHPNDGRSVDKTALSQALRSAKRDGTWDELAEKLDIETTGLKLSNYASLSRRTTMKRKLHDEVMEAVKKYLLKLEWEYKGMLAQQDKAHEDYRTGKTYTNRMLKRLPSTLTA